MTVSVIIPTYNYARFLAEAIDSVLAQTVSPLEIIVADDGSTDNTSEIVASYGNKVRYIRYNHMGVYSVRQSLLSEISGEWFINLDADNFIEPDFIKYSLDAVASAGDNCAFAYPDRIDFGAHSRNVRVPEFDIALFKKKNFVDMNAIIQTSVARKIKFDPAFNSGWGDYDFFLRIAKAGYIGVAQHSSPLHYRVHSASITAATESALDRKHNLMQKMVEKHKDFFSKEEADAALRYFSRSAAMRSHVVSLLLEHRFIAAFGRALSYNFKLLDFK